MPTFNFEVHRIHTGQIEADSLEEAVQQFKEDPDWLLDEETLETRIGKISIHPE